MREGGRKSYEGGGGRRWRRGGRSYVLPRPSPQVRHLFWLWFGHQTRRGDKRIKTIGKERWWNRGREGVRGRERPSGKKVVSVGRTFGWHCMPTSRQEYLKDGKGKKGRWNDQTIVHYYLEHQSFLPLPSRSLCLAKLPLSSLLILINFVISHWSTFQFFFFSHISICSLLATPPHLSKLPRHSQRANHK